MAESNSHEAFWVGLGALLGFCLSVGGVFLLHPLGWLGGFVAGLLVVPLMVACISKGVQPVAQPTQPAQWQLVQPDPHRQVAPPPRVVVLPRSTLGTSRRLMSDQKWEERDYEKTTNVTHRNRD